MARDTRAAFLRALTEVEPSLATAFEEAVQDIRSTAQIAALDDILRRHLAGEISIYQAMQQIEVTIQLGRQFFLPLDQAIGAAFLRGAMYQMETLPKRHPGTGTVLVARFDIRNERAERWTREAAASLITEISEDQRTLIRETIAEGVEENRGYRKIRQDLFGEMQGNQRKGALIGLHSRQAAAVRAARRELETGDFSAYLSRSEVTRDRRFDRTILKAQREGMPLTAEKIEQITGRYADGLLKYRGQMIARTEGNKAAAQGRREAVQQLIDEGTVPAGAVTKIWDAVVGMRTRDHHLMLNGRAAKWDEPFVSPKTGFAMQGPHDETAPAVDTVNCRCTLRVRLDWRQAVDA